MITLYTVALLLGCDVGDFCNDKEDAATDGENEYSDDEMEQSEFSDELMDVER